MLIKVTFKDQTRTQGLVSIFAVQLSYGIIDWDEVASKTTNWHEESDMKSNRYD